MPRVTLVAALLAVAQSVVGHGPAVEAAERAATCTTEAESDDCPQARGLVPGVCSWAGRATHDSGEAITTKTMLAVDSISMMQGSDEHIYHPRDASGGARPAREGHREIGIRVTTVCVLALLLLIAMATVWMCGAARQQVKAAVRIQAAARGTLLRPRILSNGCEWVECIFTSPIPF